MALLGASSPDATTCDPNRLDPQMGKVRGEAAPAGNTFWPRGGKPAISGTRASGAQAGDQSGGQTVQTRFFRNEIRLHAVLDERLRSLFADTADQRLFCAGREF